MSKFIEIMGKVTDIVCMSLLWIVFSLPVFTLGAATTALYHTVTKAFLDQQGYMAKEFLQAFRSNFKRSTVMWLIITLFIGLLAVDYWFLQAFVSGVYRMIFLAFVLYLAAIVAMLFNCAFSLIARFEVTVKQVCKDCIILIMANLPWNLLALFLFATAIFMVYLAPVTATFVPAVYMICQSRIYERIFKKYI